MLLKDYLNNLKQQKGLSWNDISELSGLPVDTIRSIFYGKTTDPRLDTIARIVYSMGGKLDDISDNDRVVKNDCDIKTIKENYEKRLQDKDERIKALKKDKRTFMIISGVLVSFIIIMLLLDILFGSRGWILYK